MPKLPDLQRLIRNHPNPFNPGLTIRYGLPEAAQFSLVIYDLRGNLIQTLTSEYQSAGSYDVVWHGETTQGKTMSAGIYFARLVAGAPHSNGVHYSQGIKMLKIKCELFYQTSRIICGALSE